MANDWKEQLRKAAEKQGIQVSETPTAQQSTPQNQYGRKPLRQTRNIKFDRNPRYNRNASAPYNFVPLNESVIHGERFDGFDGYATDRKTGYIECDIECLTAVYIRGTQSEQQFNQGMKSKEIADFFSPAGQTRIPGSSLRGLARTLVEILTWSKITTDRKRTFYYRGMADISNLRKEYQSWMASFDHKRKKAQYKMSAGYLRKSGTKYEVIPAQTIGGRWFFQVHKDDTKSTYPPDTGFKSYFYKSGVNSIVISGFMPNKTHDWVINPPGDVQTAIEIENVDIRNYELDENRSEPKPSCNILKMAAEMKGELLPCFYIQWKDEDENGKKRNRISFGHTAMFRLAYRNSVGNLLQDEMKASDSRKPDMAEAIFGMVPDPDKPDRKKSPEADKEKKRQPQQPIAGRVFFEDAMLTSQQPPSRTGVSRILSSPKPTTFQHYLVQTTDFVKKLNHYNSDDAAIRGHKQFWNKVEKWQAQELVFKRDALLPYLESRNVQIPPAHKEERDDKIIIRRFADLKDEKLKKAVIEFIQNDEKAQYSVIRPMPKGSRFTGRIRFENLTEVELGALLSALDLPPGCCHKIGMGKPIGLGSIHISPKLYLSNRAERRYASLAAEWKEEILPENQDEIDRLKAVFEQDIIDKLGATEKPQSSSLWQTYRLQQLRTMLDWQHTQAKNWNALTRYLEIEHPNNGNEYKNRPVLPLPEDVVRG